LEILHHRPVQESAAACLGKEVLRRHQSGPLRQGGRQAACPASLCLASGRLISRPRQIGILCRIVEPTPRSAGNSVASPRGSAGMWLAGAKEGVYRLFMSQMAAGRR